MVLSLKFTENRFDFKIIKIIIDIHRIIRTYRVHQ